MSLKEFNFPVQAGVKSSIDAKINVVQFDDGYSQRTKKGIHNRLREFSCEYVGTYFKKLNGQIVTDTETKKVLDFLEEHEGYKAFNWTSYLSPLDRKPIKVFCKKWNVTYNQGVILIGMNFNEVLA